MAEPGKVESSNKQTASEPFGKRVVGVKNPEQLSNHEFQQSKDLLFHGSGSSFEYDQKFDFSGEVFRTKDGSLTLGLGFYTTPDREAAENYASVRQTDSEEKPLIILGLLAKNAIMLDLREKEGLSNNAPFPKEMFERWREKYVRHYKNQDRTKFPWYINHFERDYLQHLDKLAQFPDVDLRSVLWTGPNKRLKDGWYPSPPWVSLFSQFMIDEGYDGVIYIEGGEGKNAKDSPTFCFYNLEKLGTYETWHQQVT